MISLRLRWHTFLGNYSPKTFKNFNLYWWQLRCAVPNMPWKWPSSSVKLPNHIPVSKLHQRNICLFRSQADWCYCAGLHYLCFVSHGKHLEMAQKHTEDFSVVCVRARRVELVIFRKQWGREQSSRWSDRAQSPNEVLLVALGVKRPCVLLLPPQKREQP